MSMFNPPHPGLLVRECMGEKLTVNALAKHLGMTRANLSMILNGRIRTRSSGLRCRRSMTFGMHGSGSA